MELINYFPHSSFRKGQKESILNIQEAIECDYKNIILDAGTGTGKSAIARTLVEYYNKEFNQNSYILTSTKILQEQYFSECIQNKHHINYRTCKGRSNFLCNFNGGYISCTDGECKNKDGFKCPYRFKVDAGDFLEGCEYFNQKEEALKSDVAICNYDILLSDYNINYFDTRHLSICDEAHNINDKIMNRIGLTLNEKRLSKLIGLRFSYEDFNNDTIDYWIIKLYELYDILKEHIDKSDMYSHSPKEVEQLEHLAQRINARVYDIVENPNFWFVYSDKFDRKIIIKPLEISAYADDYLLNKSDIQIYMSGSIVDKDNFSKYLGLNEDDVYYIKQESSFNLKEISPIIPKYVGKLSYKMKKRYLPKTIPVIEEILENHNDEKGIIHAHSKEFTNYLMENVNSSRLITYNSSDEKEDVLEYFEESDENDVIVSYSLQEGINLPYDNIRFQILFKTPFQSLADPQIKALSEIDPQWYNIETIRTIVQTIGRGIRAEDDYCCNYLIDSLFKQIINNKSFPTELKECVGD